MNIIKFKDIILSKENAPQLTREQRELFNSTFKGKYAYAVDWLYCVPLEEMSNNEYIEASQSLANEEFGNIEVVEPIALKNFTNIMYSLLIDYVDVEMTEEANDISLYIAANKYSSDSDITIDELKIFRRWLALYLLSFDQDETGKQQKKIFNDTTTHMLQYYAQDMYDDVIRYLNDFSSPLVSLGTVTSACGCNSIGTIGGTVTQSYIQQNVISKSNCGCDTSALSGNVSLNTCDPIFIYRKNIYMKMIEVFSNIDFWKQFSNIFLNDFKRYIDNIISNNFTLTTSQFVSVFADCGCLTQADTEQRKNQAILNDLSKSLQYIIDKQISGHRNFIMNSFVQWSSLLYEKMFWK